MNRDIKEYIITVYSENQIGVLNRITSLYLRRKINIEELKVSECTTKGISMFIISVFATKQTMETIIKQTMRIIEVLDAKMYTADEFVEKGCEAHRKQGK